MKFPRFLLLCMALLSGLWLGAAQALPHVDEVQAATQRGDYAGAEKMVREVLAARPDSARAHYLLAEILAHERQFKEAGEHASRARALDPAVKFTDPAKFSAFEQLLQRQQAALPSAQVPAALGNAAPPNPPNPSTASAARSESHGVPVWLLVVGAIAFIVLAMRWMSRRAAAPMPQPAMAGNGYATGPTYGYGPGVPPAPASGGTGLMGVGLAAAGGVAAGMLAERLLHGGAEERSLPREGGGSLGGGIIPGSFDSGAADELAQRGIDFGSGDGWGGDAGDSGGGSGGGDW